MTLRPIILLYLKSFHATCLLHICYFTSRVFQTWRCTPEPETGILVNQEILCLSCLSHGSCDFMVELYSESRRYTLLEVKDMTDIYAKKIGEGRSGAVYHGKLLTGREVAVKVWKPVSHSAGKEFRQFQTVSSRNA